MKITQTYATTFWACRRKVFAIIGHRYQLIEMTAVKETFYDNSRGIFNYFAGI
jgi:hypothetical protein